MHDKTTDNLTSNVTTIYGDTGKHAKEGNGWRKVFAIIGWGLGLAAAFSILVLITSVISDPSSSGPIYFALININLIFAIAFIFFIGRRFVLMFMERRRGLIGTRMHLRLLAIFSTLAILPAIVVGVFSILLLNQGVESWFSGRVTTALDGSLKVAQAYLKEHQHSLLIEAQAVSADPNVNSPTFFIDPESLKIVLNKEYNTRQLAEISIYNTDGTLVSYAGEMEPMTPTLEMIDFFKNPEGDGVGFKSLDNRRIVAIAPINEDNFVVLSRWIDASVIARVDSTKEAYQEYYELRSQRDKVLLVFTLFLILLTVAILFGAVWAGLTLASRITKPVTSLVHATNKVSAGDFNVRVTPLNDDELGILTQSFNRMASQLESNTQLLEKKNKELNERRRITEAVLTGVSAGVMSLDNTGQIILANKIAKEVLGLRLNSNIGSYSEDISHMLKEFIHSHNEVAQQQIRIKSDETDITLLVRMVTQQSSGGMVKSVVVTFDDITELMSAQKVAAWSDVAQRIAHEIKNPLTPIQLSAERLKRKYLKTIPEEDRELFSKLTETIIRQVEDMRKMVNEFSDFARMPAAVMAEENVVDIIRDIIILQREARPDIEFITEFTQGDGLIMRCDRSHLSRMFTNLIENAVNAIEESDSATEKNAKSQIKVVVDMPQCGTMVATITDSGKGLPEDVDVDKLFDPYVTTRKKGTGLGLAIVRRVIDEHGGQVRLMRREEGGTSVEMTFPLQKDVCDITIEEQQLSEA